MEKMKKCPCCSRCVREIDITFHHWMPQSEGGSLNETIILCKTCHRMLHQYIPLNQVRLYRSIEDLEKNPQYAEYLEWIREKDHPKQYSVKKVIYYLKKYHLVA